MDYTTFKKCRRSTLNYGKILRTYKNYVDTCINEGSEPDLKLLKSHNSYVDQFSLSELHMFKEIGFDLRYASAYRLRYSILSYIDDKLKTKMLMDSRMSRHKYLVDEYNKHTSNYVRTESRTIVDPAKLNISKKKSSGRSRISRQARRKARSMSQGHDPLALSCHYCGGMGEITLDKWMSLHIFTESKQAPTAVMDVHGEVGNSEVHENVVDHVGESSDMINNIGVSLSDSHSGLKTEFSLDSFFQRPVLIYQSTWDIGSYQNLKFNIWDLWSKDASVRAKLNNYAFFKANAHIKIAFTGSPYHFGTAMASYQPYPDFNSNLSLYEMMDAANFNQRTAYSCYLSQAPGVTYFDYKENRPKELTIPFISHKQKYRLYNDASTVITPNTSYTDLLEAGALYLTTLNTPRDANDDNATGVGVAIYVWMSDVELGSITSTDVNITAESRTIFTESSTVTKVMDRYESVKANPDEYTEPGPVSKVASAVSAAASNLVSIPYIGPFAKATTTVSRMLGDVAMMFGFSKPLQLDDAEFRKNIPFTNGAVTSGKDTAFKLALDPKQELCIDQSLGGMDKDQMSIQEISSRESFITYFRWDQSDAALSKILWKTLVLPNMFVPVTVGPSGSNNSWVQPTAMMFAAQPFSSWRGTIRFRFEVTCSKFHRGKLLFKFDPNVPAHALISSASVKMNQQNVIILDIQEAQEIVIDVDWAHARDWAEGRLMESWERPHNQLENEQQNLPNTADFDAYNPGQSNGFLEIRPFTNLVQPTADSFVYVNVFVSCPDLEVARLTNAHMPVSREIRTESRTLSPQKINHTSAHIDEKMFLNHYGERVVSFRNLLKRYVTSHMDNQIIGNTGEKLQIVTSSIYPFDALKPGQIPFLDKPMINQNNLFSYLKFAYLGMRGGYRHRLVLSASHEKVGYTRVSLNQGMIGPYLLPPSSTISNLASGALLNDSFSSTLNGTALYHVETNGGIEFEIPYYSRNLFEFAFSNDYGNEESTDTDLGFEDTLGSATWQAAQIHRVVSTSTALVTQIDSASAEDFTFLRFQGAPGFYKDTFFVFSDSPEEQDDETDINNSTGAKRKRSKRNTGQLRQ